MKSILSRVNKRLMDTTQAFFNDSKYSLSLAVYRLGDELGGRLGFDSLSWRSNQKKHKWILNYLETLLNPIIELYKNSSDNGIQLDNSPIWVCWWDGFDNAPLLVQRCIESIYKFAENHPVHFITKENVSRFINIPEYMTEKVKSGNMGLAHLADYIRVSLLAQYGGLWLDATIYCSRRIPERIFSYPIYSMKSEPQNCRYISKHRWVSFCLGSWKGNPLYKFLKEAFELYWQVQEKAIDYLFFDYLLLIALTNIPSAKSFDDVPINNIHRDDLREAMNASISESQWDKIIKYDTVFYKLSWRETYLEKTENNDFTVFGKLIHEETVNNMN